MSPIEFEAKVENFASLLVDERGETRPIERIEFEPLGSQVRWNIWSEGRRLQSVTTSPDDLDGLLEASKLLLQIMTHTGER